MCALWRRVRVRARLCQSGTARCLFGKTQARCPTVSDAYQLNPEQVTAVSLINLQVNQLRSAAHELRQPHLKQAEAAKLLDAAGIALEDAKLAWLRATQALVKVSPVIPSLSVAR